jgi:hypothetical protein
MKKRLAGSAPELTPQAPPPGALTTTNKSKLLGAAAEQKDDQEHRNWDSDQPQKDISERSFFFDPVCKFHGSWVLKF